MPERLTDYLRFFRNKEDEEAVEELGAARRFLDWSGQDYHKDFLGWLDDEASKPFDLDNTEQIKISAVRANTFREIQKRLLRLEREATAAMQRFQEGT